MAQPEARLSRKIQQHLRETYPGIFVFKVWGSEHQMAGLPDLLGCWCGRFFGLEVKMPEKRSDVSPRQRFVMVIAGEVDENRSVDMTQKIFRPLRQLAQKHEVGICIVHHLKKGENGKFVRGGQLMLGSVANHAWSEDSMYLRIERGGTINVERESKHAASYGFKIRGLRQKGWQPDVSDVKGDEEEETKQGRSNGAARRVGAVQRALNELGPGSHSLATIREQANIQAHSAQVQLGRLRDQGLVKKLPSGLWQVGTNG